MRSKIVVGTWAKAKASRMIAKAKRRLWATYEGVALPDERLTAFITLGEDLKKLRDRA